MSGPAAHPDVTWPLSTPSSSGLARCARETLVVDLAALSCALLPPQQLCSPRQPRARTAAITHSKNPKTFAGLPRLSQISPFWAVLPPHQQCFPANSEQRQQRALRERQRERTVLSSAAAAAIASRACAQLPKPAQHLPKQKTTFQTFWVFWLTIRFKDKPN
ncbi:hypothetical protein TYRP_009037 [Tyrophagus putrescentiae]|nr:hypothetical protein TYRP_009037 [Tyrophagus putrescentiae]